MQTGALTPDNATPGRILAAARGERGMSVSEVAQRLKFSIRHIEALEADHYDALPSGPYVRGMVRTYAKLLGVDPARLLDDLPQASDAGEPAMQPRDMSVPFPQDARPGSRVYLLLSMLIIVAVIVVLAEWFIRSQRAALEEAGVPPPVAEPVRKAEPPPPSPVPANAGGESSPQPASEAMPAQPAPPSKSESLASAPTSQPTAESTPPANGSAPPASESTSPAAERPAAIQASSAGLDGHNPAQSGPLAPGQSRLTFDFDLESWVEVKDANGDVLLSAINPAGTEKQVVGTGPFSVVIGNASGVRLTYNGTPVTLKPRQTSDVARLTLE